MSDCHLSGSKDNRTSIVKQMLGLLWDKSLLLQQLHTESRGCYCRKWKWSPTITCVALFLTVNQNQVSMPHWISDRYGGNESCSKREVPHCENTPLKVKGLRKMLHKVCKVKVHILPRNVLSYILLHYYYWCVNGILFVWTMELMLIPLYAFRFSLCFFPPNL